MTEKQKLPRYVSINGGKYRYREYLGVVDGKVKFGPSVILASSDAPMSEVWAAYEGLTKEQPETIGWLLTKYSESDSFKALKPKTKKDYERSFRKLRRRRRRHKVRRRQAGSGQQALYKELSGQLPVASGSQQAHRCAEERVVLGAAEV